jgi:hypothetical protein
VHVSRLLVFLMSAALSIGRISHWSLVGEVVEYEPHNNLEIPLDSLSFCRCIHHCLVNMKSKSGEAGLSISNPTAPKPSRSRKKTDLKHAELRV